MESHTHVTEGDQKLQGDHSGCTLGVVDIKTKVTFFLNLITVPSHLHQAISDTSKMNAGYQNVKDHEEEEGGHIF